MRIKGGFLTAKIMHKRLFPKINQFTYFVFYICADIKKIKNIKSLFFSVNRFNIFSFYNKDHGKKNDQDPEKWLLEILAQNNIKNIENIVLLSHPRILGYVFNPVSFWFCLNKDQELMAVLAEVNNTFKESHNYLIYDEKNKKIDNQTKYIAKKEFHVSPFMKRKGHYEFRFDFSQNNIFVAIDFFNDKNEKILLTSLSGKRQDLTSKTLLFNFFKFPFLTFKIIFLIHYQAIKLILKKIKYIPKPIQYKHKLTKTK